MDLHMASNNYYNKGSYVTLKIVLGLLVEEAKKMLSGLVYMSSSKCSGSILGEVLLIGCTKEVDVKSRASEVDSVWYGVNTLCKECKNHEPWRNHKINEFKSCENYSEPTYGKDRELVVVKLS